MAITLDIINDIVKDVSGVDVHNITGGTKHYASMVRRIFITLVKRHAPQLLYSSQKYLNMEQSAFLYIKNTINWIDRPEHMGHRIMLYNCSQTIIQNYPEADLRGFDNKFGKFESSFGR